VQAIPDEKTVGEIAMTFTGRYYPQGSETTYGPYTASTKNDLRLTARQITVEYTFMADTARLGDVRLDVRPGGLR
jgi:hypothetical protein